MKKTGRMLWWASLIGLGLVLATWPASVPRASAVEASEASAIEASEDTVAAADEPHDWFYEGLDKGGDFGYSVSTAGDVDGDGYDDVIVGAPKVTGDIYREGWAYLFEGSPGGLSKLVPDWSAGGGVQGSLFGLSVSAAGDVNDDGYDDVIIGAPEYKYDDSKKGAVFVYYGSSGGLLTATPDWVYLGPQKDAEFGYSVGGAGDVNDDGFDDVVVGARWYSDTLTNEGAAFVFYGSDTGLGDTPDWMAVGGQATAGFGSSVGTAGDVNGDGCDDVLVGAPQYNAAYLDEGAAFVYYGCAAPASFAGPALRAGPDWSAYGGQEDARFGTVVAAAGSVNGGAAGDIIVGAPNYTVDEAVVGAAFAFYGPLAGLDDTADWVAVSHQVGTGFGRSVGTAGDVNADGYDDVLVGAYRYSRDQAQEGAVFVYHGSSAGLHYKIGWHAEGDKAETWFGFATGTAGDVNKDGYADVLAGAPLFKLDRDPRGRAFGYYGPIEAPEFSISLPLIMRQYEAGIP